MPVEDQIVWGEKGDAVTKAMLLLMNLKNNNAKKDLHLAYSQGNKLAYSVTAKAMAKYMSTQYPYKNPGHKCDNKKVDTNWKKGDNWDNPKSEEKDNNYTGTTGVYVGDATTPEDSIAPGGGSSIGAHVLEATKQPSLTTQSVEYLLGAHSIGDGIWGETNPCDVSIDTANSKEVMTGSHITEQHTFQFCRSNQHELLNVTAYKPRKDDLSWD